MKNFHFLYRSSTLRRAAMRNNNKFTPKDKFVVVSEIIVFKGTEPILIPLGTKLEFVSTGKLGRFIQHTFEDAAKNSVTVFNSQIFCLKKL